ncbi:hypothetical protein GOB94_09205 [Granulicella sp. 5B5]|uniref:hypothetical protein n=1 Tax=Granulicella sp. 5B5 TaxID=1617967 RepID=UPI0015F641FD|nr:hypothetical protein [Granulicella sp. 5B5]QMV18839.1 hypothetical protein GOB94_09205 [Granulicella sp. 5B5]
MGYLQPADYAAFGLSADTADAWVTAASAMMEAYCRRPSLLAASYTERMRVPLRAQTVRLSYTPLISVDAVQAQYARPRFGDEFDGDMYGGYGPGLLAGPYLAAFAAPNQWVPVDTSTLDISLPTGEFRFAWNMMGLRYAYAEVTYTAGLNTVPDAVKVACAQIVKNAQATPGLNVKSSRMDTLQTQYFSDSLLDSQVQAILRPYVAERLG